MWRAPKRYMVPFMNFMQAVVTAAGLLGVLRSNKEGAGQMRKTIMDYFSHCDENYWAPNLGLRADRAAAGLSPEESGPST